MVVTSKSNQNQHHKSAGIFKLDPALLGCRESHTQGIQLDKALRTGLALLFDGYSHDIGFWLSLPY